MSGSESRVVVVGGGLMGGDIAATFAAGGWGVQVTSPSAATRDTVPSRVAAALQAMGVHASRAGVVRTHARLEDVDWAGVDLVIETVTENLALKQQVFAQLEALAGRDTPLASNSSNFSISEIGKSLAHRHRLVGLHFFMPAHWVPLVEVISGVDTDPGYTDRVCEVMRALGKKPIRVRKDVPGFVGNRIQHAMMREALYLIEDGVATPEDVDLAVRYGFGFRFIACGPILQKEMSGWDTNLKASSALYPHLHNEAAYPASIRAMVERGDLGMKSGRGFWQWTAEDAAKEKARIEALLKAGLKILEDDDRSQER